MKTRDEILAGAPLLEWVQAHGHAPKRSGASWLMCCPFHADKTPSLSITPGKGAGGVWHCHGCGTGGSLVDWLMLEKGIDDKAALELLDAAGAKAPPPAKGRFVCHYDYTDADGTPVYRVARFEPKTFRQYRPGPDGKWIPGLEGVERVLFRLHKIMRAELVAVCEGEKDVLTLESFKIAATCCSGGSGGWLDGYGETLRGKDILIFPDNDKPGEKYCEAVKRSLAGKARSLAVVRVTDPAKDITEWLDAFAPDDAKAAALAMLISQHPLHKPGADTPIYSTEELQDMYREQVMREDEGSLDLGKWLPTLGRYVRKISPGEMVVLMGDTGGCKTACIQNIVRHTSLPTLYFQLELPVRPTYERYAAIDLGKTTTGIYDSVKAGKRIDRIMPHLWTCLESGLTIERLKELIVMSELKMEVRPAVVIVDYIGLLRGKGERYERLSDIAEELRIMAKNKNVVMILASQIRRKGEDGDARPGLHDAKDSGAIENSASLVLGVNREGENELMMRILKNTQGRAHIEIKCNFHGESMRITEQIKIKQTGLPYADNND